jgi:hypothetical protein
VNNHLKSKLTRFVEDRSGAVTVTAAVWLGFAGIALAGLGIDGANLYRVKDALQQSSNRAAVAGAAQLDVSQSVAISTAKTYSSDSATPGLNGIKAVQSVTTTATAACVLSLLPGAATTCPGTGYNVITVAQTATVNTFFGLGSKTITATSAASGNGGSGGFSGPTDVVIILDSTASMATCDTGSCNPNANPFHAPIACPAPAPSTMSKMQAAQLGIQTLLCTFAPASGSTGTQVALMTFPGVSNPSVDYCGTTGTALPVNYSTATNYQIVPFKSDFRTSATATTLNQNSDLVKAVGGNSTCKGVQNIGGKGTYYAGAITAAQTYLTSSGRTNAQKVIFVLSDGDASANSGTQISASLATNQCKQAITNADAAATAGTWVFSLAYDAGTTGCATDSGIYKNACLAMEDVASSPGQLPDSAKFFAFNAAGNGGTCTSHNANLPTLAATFQAAWQTMTAARLIPYSCVTSGNCKL